MKVWGRDFSTEGIGLRKQATGLTAPAFISFGTNSNFGLFRFGEVLGKLCGGQQLHRAIATFAKDVVAFFARSKQS